MVSQNSNEFPQMVAMICLFHCNMKYILVIIDSPLAENSHSSLHGREDILIQNLITCASEIVNYNFTFPA